jgi:hypothetical protein
VVAPRPRCGRADRATVLQGPRRRGRPRARRRGGPRGEPHQPARRRAARHRRRSPRPPHDEVPRGGGVLRETTVSMGAPLVPSDPSSSRRARCGRAGRGRFHRLRGRPRGDLPRGQGQPRATRWPQRGHTGVARIALAARAAVVPVGIWGTQHRWSWSGLDLGLPLRPRVAIVFGRPIAPVGSVSNVDDVQAFTGAVMRAIEEQVDAAREIEGA